MTDDKEFFDEIDEEPARVAYIRRVLKSEVADAPEGAPDTLYALHDGDGRPLALFSTHDSAIITARTHNFQTVTVH